MALSAAKTRIAFSAWRRPKKSDHEGTTPGDPSAETEVRRQFYLLYDLQKYIFIRRMRGGDAGLADHNRRLVLDLASALG